MTHVVELGLLKAVLTNKHGLGLTQGSPANENGLHFTAGILRHNHDPQFLKRLVKALLPEGYSGNLLGEIKGMVKGGIAKGMHEVAEVTEGHPHWPDTFKDGSPRTTFRNALLCLILLAVNIRYDLFRLRISVNGLAVQEFSGDMTDDGIAMLRKASVDAFGFDPGKTNVADAAHTLALQNAFHPIRDYLDDVEWDGLERIEMLLVDYFGAEDTEINRAFSTMILVAAVRRVRVPGTKFDTMLVLEGPQGSGKSTAIKNLAGDENFSDQAVIGLDQKTQGELLSGVWLYEIAELSGLRHTDTNDLKSFLSRDTDRYRAAYARFTTSSPRQLVFIGTTNDETYLKDVTGNRRIWPVLTDKIDLEGLRRDRDQLWAEAAHWEAQGHPIVLPEDLREDATKLQKARLPRDPWLDQLNEISGIKTVSEEQRVSTKTLFGEDNLNIAAGTRQDFHAKRLSRVMAELGWEGPRVFKLRGTSQRGYCRPVDTDGEIDDTQF